MPQAVSLSPPECNMLTSQCLGTVVRFPRLNGQALTLFRNDSRASDAPTLVLHGADDQIVPIGASGLMTTRS